MKTLSTFTIIIFLIHLNLNSQVFVKETVLDTNTIITGLDVPWEIQWGPDDHIWTTERFGRVSRINPETGVQHVILEISNLVYQSGESGLLGMVLHPDFENEPYIYLAYTYRPSGQILEKIVRYEYDNGELKNEFVLIDNIQGNTTHDGCRMIILPDNTLLFSTGDAQNQSAPQNIDHLSGKTLRLNLDGSVPADNPFPGNPVFSFGHRNAQGLFLAPNGIIYSSEHGPSTDDEFNIIESGRNYGWPDVHGFCNLPDEITFCEKNNVKEPLAAWTPTVATSDIIFYDHPSISEWEGRILLTSLKNKRLYVLELDETGTSVVSQDQYFINWWGRLRDVCMGPDGAVYFATNGASWSNTDPFTHSIVKVWNPDYVSIAEKENTTIKLYPNPAKDNVNISVKNELIGSIAKIYSTDGKLILSKRIDGMNTVVSTHELNTGLYFVTVGNEKNAAFSEKLFITNY